MVRTILPALRLFLLNLLRPVTELIGKVHMPFSVKAITEDEVHEALNLALPGMVFATRTRGQLDNLPIPGFWCHNATVEDSWHVVEATGEGVLSNGIFNFLLKKDYAVLLRPRFATVEQMAAAAAFIKDQIGAGYDYNFLDVVETEQEIKTSVVKDRRFYCSKLPWAAYRSVCGPDIPFTTRETLGVQTVVPSDYVNATKLWEVVWASSLAKPLLPKT